MALTKYSGRPFLLAFHYKVPKKGVKTEKKGWNKDDQSFDIVEETNFVDSISKKRLEESSVIIDILNASVVKSRYSDNHNKVYQYYMEKYKNDVEKACTEFFKRNPEKTKEFFSQKTDESYSNYENG